MIFKEDKGTEQLKINSFSFIIHVLISTVYSLCVLTGKMDEWGRGHKEISISGRQLDKDILPSYRTTDRKTESIHLFQIYAIVDRYSTSSPKGSSGFEDNLTFIPSLLEQEQLLKELTYIFASAIIRHVPQVTKHFEKSLPKTLGS